MGTIRIFPSLISADILNLEKTIRDLDPYCDGFHIDIMDNHFVPNLTWGSMFARAIDHISLHPSWVHLMVEQPQKIISELAIKGQSIISFHIESTDAVYKTIELIHKNGCVASIALKPSTSLEKIYPYMAYVQHVLLMSVEPGFSGQSFIHESLHRLKALMAYRQQHQLNYIVGMDGGINLSTIAACMQQGATDFAIASAIFSQANILDALKNYTQLTS